MNDNYLKGNNLWLLGSDLELRQQYTGKTHVVTGRVQPEVQLRLPNLKFQ
jgi:hypothetical protein